MKRLFIALTYGLWAVSALANAQVRGEDSYIPPDYDVGHPQLISEAKVLLTESELAKKSYNRPRKIAKIQLSEETIAGIKEQIEALLPETPTMNAGVFANAKWWVSVDGSTQHSEVLYDVNRSFCYRPMLNKEYTVKLRVTRQDNLSHTTAFSFTPTLPNIDNLAIRSDLASVYVSYGVANNITPPSYAY